MAALTVRASVCSANPHKLEELHPLFPDWELELLGAELPPEDGATFRPAGTATHRVPATEAGPLGRTLRVENLAVKARYVRVVAENVGTIPKGQPAAGARAWLFADELLVNERIESRPPMP